MHNWRIFLMIIIVLFFSGVANWTASMAQEDEYNLAYDEAVPLWENYIYNTLKTKFLEEQ